MIWHTIILLLCKSTIQDIRQNCYLYDNILSVQKCEHRSGLYHLGQYRTAPPDIEKHYDVIKQYKIIEHTTTL